MCLLYPQRVNDSEGIIAYKVVERLGGKNFFLALKTKAIYKVGMSYVSLVNRVIDVLKHSIILEAIHLFADLETAKKVADLHLKYSKPEGIIEKRVAIIKCYIPKNALVFKGEDNHGNPAYATNRIRILKVIEEYELPQCTTHIPGRTEGNDEDS